MTVSGDINQFPAVLLKQAIAGDESAFKEIYEKLSGKMYSLCLRYAKDADNANDLFQEGFVKLYRNLHHFRNEGSFEGWARRIFVNTCLDSIKRKSYQFTDIEDVDTKEASDISGYDTLAVKDVMQLLQQVPGNYRTVINLSIIEGYSHKEIGVMLGVSENASKALLHKAKKYFKKIYTEQVG